MNQTRIGSLIEVAINIAIGFGINWIANLCILLQLRTVSASSAATVALGQPSSPAIARHGAHLARLASLVASNRRTVRLVGSQDVASLDNGVARLHTITAPVRHRFRATHHRRCRRVAEHHRGALIHRAARASAQVVGRCRNAVHLRHACGAGTVAVLQSQRRGIYPNSLNRTGSCSGSGYWLGGGCINSRCNWRLVSRGRGWRLTLKSCSGALLLCVISY